MLSPTISQIKNTPQILMLRIALIFQALSLMENSIEKHILEKSFLPETMYSLDV